MIRQAQYTERVPYMIIVGEKEIAEHTISIRTQDSKTVTMSPEEFLAKIQTEIKDRV
jgi:threonyl-tRNA synthetase